MKRFGYIAAGTVGGLLLLIVLTVVFIPSDSIRQVVRQGLALNGYSMTAERFGKAFPLGISARKLEIAGEKGPVFKADEAAVRLNILPLLAGKVRIGLDARVGTGRITGEYTLNGGGSARLDIVRVRLEDVPFFTTVAGMQAKGELRGKAAIRSLRKNPVGDVQLEVKAAELTGIKLGPTPFPDAAYPLIQGKLLLKEGKAIVESFTLHGDTLFVRLKGDVPLAVPLSASPLNVTLELMPKPEFLEKQKWVFLLLTKYLDTPGHYQIPVRGSLGQPSVF